MRDLGKRNIIGVCIDAVDYEAATERIVRSAKLREPFAGTALSVHAVMMGALDARHRHRLNTLDLVAPDGQPVRWALNLLYRTGLTDRVYGPQLTMHVMERAAAEGLGVFFYGSRQSVLVDMAKNLQSRWPELKVVGTEEGLYRPITPVEVEDVVARISASGARILFVGLGAPRQERFLYALRDSIGVPMLAVGAAFDYHAGHLRAPPPLLQRHGLEWAWRFILEPRRLWKRYVLYNPLYLAMVALQALRLWRPKTTGVVTSFHDPFDG